MANSFSDLKNSRSVRTLSKNLEKFESSESKKDDRFWTPKKDAAGNYTGIIRFLPAPQGESDAFVRLYNHGFQVNGKWFIENCPTTLGKECPICEHNSELWNSGIESNQKLVSQHRKRKESYYCNIIVIKDPSEPANDGKVFLYRIGTKLMEKIKAVAKGDESLGESGNDVENFWTGQDLVLKIREAKGYPTYEDSIFKAPSALFGGDDSKLEQVFNSLHSLQDIIATDKFKSYDTLKAAHDKIINGRQNTVKPAAEVEPQDFTSAPTQQTPRKAAVTIDENDAPFKTSQEQDPLSFFKDLEKDL